ncbi:hypothetical protein F5Y08DRAFT_321334 [Xylaria arbuscula]|nr:hypothetical protein F5Y08DRAFT_321334 [Xylaria arbuscula]
MKVINVCSLLNNPLRSHRHGHTNLTCSQASLIISVFAATAQAAIIATTNSTTTITTTASTTTTTTTTTSSYSSTPTPTPTYVMHCGSSISELCGDVCFCGSGGMNCHADPSARCYQMCRCVAEYPQGKRRGIPAMLGL